MSPALWWFQWQLPILVLASLAAQYFLVLFAGVRKFHIPPWLRVSFRLAHIGSDALAIFALATLFNRQSPPSIGSVLAHQTTFDVELLWLPLLLMHLGGQVVITSYKIEDNEEWSRHILISLSKVTIGLYFFYKSWISKQKRLLAATVLLFILVIIRCLQKVLDLKSTSFNALRKASFETSVVQSTKVTEEGRLENLIEKAREVVNRDGPWRSMDLPSLPYQLFLDFPFLDSDRVEILNNFWLLDIKSAYRAVEGTLSAMTSFLYTKDETTPYLGSKNAPASVIFRWCTLVLVYATLITAIYLINPRIHKDFFYGKDGWIIYRRRDNWLTYVMLYGTLLLEIVHLFVKYALRGRFSGRIFQYSIIGLLAHNKWHFRLSKIAGWLQCKDFLNDFWHMKPSNSCKEITELVRLQVKIGWRTYIRDRDSYRRFNETRGDWTLGTYQCSQRLGWSTMRPFDESIIIWHLATDFCFHHPAVAVTPGDPDYSRAHQCKEMSNYMMHLLFENPEMLMPGSRKNLFTRAYSELEDIIGGEEMSRDEREFTQKVIEKCSAGSSPDSFVGDAYNLVKSLLDFRDSSDGTRMWKVIEGVWVEMLCFSAGRCRGYLHAEALGTGVEYLSYVWVLWAYAGMETFPEKLQRREGFSVDSDESCGLERKMRRTQSI